jgi:hypothetical protein
LRVVVKGPSRFRVNLPAEPGWTPAASMAQDPGMDPAEDHGGGIPVLLARTALSLLRAAAAALLFAPILLLGWLVLG